MAENSFTLLPQGRNRKSLQIHAVGTEDSQTMLSCLQAWQTQSSAHQAMEQK
jgi:hypothetical protein